MTTYDKYFPTCKQSLPAAIAVPDIAESPLRRQLAILISNYGDHTLLNPSVQAIKLPMLTGIKKLMD